MEEQLWHVSQYEETQVYGGPEEGGWWADLTHYVATLGSFTRREDAVKFRNQQVKRFEEENADRERQVNYGLANMPEDGPDYPDTEGYIPRGQVGGDRVIFMIEDEPRSHEQTEVPRYE
jgi:hypothetical protein